MPTRSEGGVEQDPEAPFATTADDGGLEKLFQLSLEMLCIAGTDGYFLRVNPAFERTLGFTVHELQSRPFIDFVHVDDREKTLSEMCALIDGNPTIHFENRYRCRDGSYRWLSWKAMPGEHRKLIYAVASDVTYRKEAEKRERFAKTLLEKFSKSTTRKTYLEAVVEMIRDWLECRCVGIRAVDTEVASLQDSYLGFSPDAWENENPTGPENRFASVSIIPIRYHEEIVAAIHLADERPSMFPPASIEFIESMAPLIGEAIQRFSMAEEIEANLRIQLVIGEILRTSLSSISLESLLQRALDLLFSLPWLALRSQGAIYVIEENPDVLVMKAHRGLSEEQFAGAGNLLLDRLDDHDRNEESGEGIPFFAGWNDARRESYCPRISPEGRYTIPIVSGNRRNGIICLYVDKNHRQKSGEEFLLVSIADLLAGIISRKHIEESLKENQLQLVAAQRIQSHLLPSESPSLPGFDIFGESRPAEFAGGDTFDYLTMQDGSLTLAIGDVSGHGFAPSLLMASTHAYARSLARMSNDVGEILTRTNAILSDEIEEDRFVTFLLARIDPQARSLTYSSAGHQTGYLLDVEGKVIARLKSTNLPLGISRDAVFPVVGPLSLEPGHLLLLITDGVPEAKSPEGIPLGERRMLDIVQSHRDQSSRRIIQALVESVRNYARTERPIDDITAVILKVEA